MRLISADVTIDQSKLERVRTFPSLGSFASTEISGRVEMEYVDIGALFSALFPPPVTKDLGDGVYEYTFSAVLPDAGPSTIGVRRWFPSAEDADRIFAALREAFMSTGMSVLEFDERTGADEGERGDG